MKTHYTLLFALTLITLGCIGDKALPIVSTTGIPDTQLKVHLGGPDAKDNFGYYVTALKGSHFGYRRLGRLKPDQTKPVSIKSYGDGVFRIQWGSGSTAQFAIIDVKKEQFVEDSNPANPKNQSFAKQ